MKQSQITHFKCDGTDYVAIEAEDKATYQDAQANVIGLATPSTVNDYTIITGWDDTDAGEFGHKPYNNIDLNAFTNNERHCFIVTRILELHAERAA